MSKPIAYHGGQPLLPEGPPGWPRTDSAIRAAVEAALRDQTWGLYRGPHTQRLADRLAEWFDCPHVLLCASGTVAVELALRGVGVGPEDEVLLAGYDYPGNFRSIEALGARPVLVDVRDDDWNIDTRHLEAALSERVRAILVSHLHGGLVRMQQVREFAHAHRLAVVEDACQVPGATVLGRPAGAWGDAAALSFGGSKLLSAGRGGAVLTRRDDVLQRIKVFAQRGNDAFPLSQLQAAVLLPQLERLAEHTARRAEAAAELARRIDRLPGLKMLPCTLPDSRPAYYKVGIAYTADELGGLPRETLIAALQAEGIAIDVGFAGFALRSARRCRRVGDLPEARRAAAGILVLHHPVLLESPEVLSRLAAAFERVTAAFAT